MTKGNNKQQGKQKMGTYATIGIMNEDDYSVTASQVKWDGGLWSVGKLLLQHYNTEEKARELVSLGNVDKVYPTIEETKASTNHKWMRGEPTTTKHGERWQDSEYNYLWSFGEWRLTSPIPLKECYKYSLENG